MKKLLFTILMTSSFIGVGQENQEYLKYFNSGQSKFESGDFYGAIYEYTKAIEVLDGFHPPSLTNRALAKAMIGDLDSAYNDINYVIEVVPEFGATYFYRGLIKYQHSQDYYGAISDFLRAIEYDNKNGKYVHYLGLTKEKIGDINGSCNDWKKAVKLGYQDASKLVEEKCN